MRLKISVNQWLIVCLSMIALMVIVGGYTRLTGSGLSITEWKPIHGVIPPLSEAEWLEEFEAYRQIPQYKTINKGMSLDEFKSIYWPEFWHRVLGRLIGIVFFVPLVYFTVKRQLPRSMLPRLGGIFVLGGLQGAMGWYMVASGLADNPYVSHLRLAAHLGLAFILFALILWTYLDIRAGKPAPVQYLPKQVPLPRLFDRRGWLILTLLFLQILLGAMLAGLHGGLIFNTFPTMNGQWLPPDLLALAPTWMNFFENITTIQFMHRWNAKILTVLVIFWWWKAYKSGSTTRVMHAVVLVVALQFALGVATLLYQVPLTLALLHQITALVLFGLVVGVLHKGKQGA